MDINKPYKEKKNSRLWSSGFIKWQSTQISKVKNCSVITRYKTQWNLKTLSRKGRKGEEKENTIYHALYTLGIFPAKWWPKENIKLINVDTAEQFGVTAKLLGVTKHTSSESILPEQITTYFGGGEHHRKVRSKKE